jgi:collagen type VII alpha
MAYKKLSALPAITSAVGSDLMYVVVQEGGIEVSKKITVQNLSGSAFSGYSGYSSFSGYSGYSSTSGYSGISGYSGYSAGSGYSGYSGSGVSGYSGHSGDSGYSGYVGAGIISKGSWDEFATYAMNDMVIYIDTNYVSLINGNLGNTPEDGAIWGIFASPGMSGYSGATGTSGYSGFSGVNGASGFSGYSGVSTSGFSGYSGPPGAGTGYYGTFTNANLVAGKMTVTHALGALYEMVQVFDHLNRLVIADEITLIDVNTCEIDISSFGTIAGTWSVVVSNGAGRSGSAGISGYSGYSGLNGVAAVINGSFTNASLSAGILAFNHNLGQQWPFIQVSNGDNLWVLPDQIHFASTSQALIDLTSYGTITGTWHATAIGF